MHAASSIFSPDGLTPRAKMGPAPPPAARAVKSPRTACPWRLFRYSAHVLALRAPLAEAPCCSAGAIFAAATAF